MYNYEIAGVAFSADIRYEYTYNLMKSYLCDDSEPEFTLTVSDEEIEQELLLSPHEVTLPVCESIALYRKYIYIVMERYDAFFFHCSSVAVDGEAVLFTAQSGTGKSTHRNLWLKNFGNRVTVINDDKPIIRRIDGKFYVCGTPWRGKEGKGENIRVPAKALCFLSRAGENSIGPIDTASVVARSLNQTIRPDNPALMSKLLDLLDGFIGQVDCYDLRVNMDDEAALVAYNGIFNNKPH